MNPTPPTAREPQVLLSDLSAELLWTRALRTPALALRPSRILLGMVAVFLAALIGKLSPRSEEAPSIAESLINPFWASMANMADGLASLSAARFMDAVGSLALLPGRLFIDRPWETVLFGVPLVLVFVLLGGAISRSAATEFATARISDWPADLRISVSKGGWSLLAMVGPLAIAGVLVGVIVLGGSLLGVPVLNVIGALLYVVALVLALGALFLFIMQALALPMLIPAMMCEGTDAYDAVQRCYAYILARPLRLLFHAAILLVLGAVSIAFFAALAGGSVELTGWAATRLPSDAGTRVINGGTDLAATQPLAHGLISGWRALVEVFVAGFAFSYFFSAGTVLYLIARRICDGQGTGDIWAPEAGATGGA